MANDATPRDILAQTMKDGRQVMVPYLAEMLKRKGISELDSNEQRRRFWQSALTDEQEQAMWRQEMADRGLTQLEPGSMETLDIGLKISKAKYPDRWDMLAGEGRDSLSQQADWAAAMARKGPPAPEAASPAPTTEAAP